MEEKVKKALTQGVETLGVTLDEKKIRQLLQYLFVLEKWNKAYNLSAIRNIEEMVSRHLLDSLAVLPILLNESHLSSGTQTLADIGTGAGLPGLPLAIACPQWQISLIDSNAKKTGFLKHALMITKLENVAVITDRVEDLDQTYDMVISRAFASLKDIINLTRPICREDTVIWAMKGKYPEEELRELPKPYIVSAAHQLHVPMCEGERHFLKIVKGRT